MKIRSILPIVLMALIAACASTGYQIEQTDTGYSVGDLPNDILAGFPQEHQVKLMLQDGDETASVTGLASVSEGILRIMTDETMAFTVGSADTYFMLMSVEGTVNAAAWGGCVANPALRQYRDNPKTCWCWSDGVAVAAPVEEPIVDDAGEMEEEAPEDTTASG